uniref:Uncharacterized protein n=1 Tax=Populus trichocarpa TaxID=3694 RepID=A0A3N7EES3_POPTR
MHVRLWFFAEKIERIKLATRRSNCKTIHWFLSRLFLFSLSLQKYIYIYIYTGEASDLYPYLLS